MKKVLGNLGDLYDYIVFVLNQEELGEVVNAENFNALLYAATEEFYNAEYEKIIQALQIDGTPIGTKIFYGSPLSVFLKSVDLPSPFTFPSDLFATIGGVADGKPLEFLNEESFSKRVYNILGMDVNRHPVFKESQGKYIVVPSSITEISVTYLRKQNIPNFDYCQDNSGISDDIYYMPVGYEIREDGNLYANNTDTTAVQSNVVHFPAPASFPYVSQSIELEYKDVDKKKIADLIISMAAERSRELNLSQIEEQKK